ncbi:Aminotran-1-2 domain-containing protein [Aphelenchoides fujianensis]|nr:Aminotran-1-2 domain-containing protein [Aphelenchoides fujianensis]
MPDEPFTLFDSVLGPTRYHLNIGAPSPPWLKRMAELMVDVTPKRLADEQSAAANGRPDAFLKSGYQDRSSTKCIVYCDQLTYFLGVEMLKKMEFTPARKKTAWTLKNLEQQLERDLPNVEDDRKAGRFSAAFYGIPTFHNPTGIVLSERKCKELVRLARKFNLLPLLRRRLQLSFSYSEGPIPKRLFAYDDPNDADYDGGHVISNGTFSKLLSPALRLGWMELPLRIKEKHWINSPILHSSGSLNTYTGGLVAELLHSGVAAEHIAAVRAEQKTKMAAAVRILEEGAARRLPPREQAEGLSAAACNRVIPSVQGGYFMYVRLPKEVNSTEAARYLKEKYDVGVVDGRRCLVGEEASGQSEEAVENGIRLSIAYPPLEEVEEGFRLVCKALNELLTQSSA